MIKELKESFYDSPIEEKILMIGAGVILFALGISLISVIFEVWYVRFHGGWGR